MQSGPKNPLQQPRFCKRYSVGEHPGHTSSHTGCFCLLASSSEHRDGYESPSGTSLTIRMWGVVQWQSACLVCEALGSIPTTDTKTNKPNKNPSKLNKRNAWEEEPPSTQLGNPQTKRKWPGSPGSAGLPRLTVVVWLQ